MEHLKKLYIKNDKKITKIAADNYLLSQNEETLKKFSDAYFNLSEERIYEIQQEITKAHCQHEMNFQIKDETGQYNKVVATPFHGFAPLKKSYIDELVKSTAPLLKATRKLLQKLYSQSDLTIKSLEIEHIPTEQAQELLSIINNNIYFEAKLIHPNMANYPFLSIVGFDSAIANLSYPENIFFEFNAGTPCGIEDQYQLFEHFKIHAPELTKLITPYMAKDESHKFLKETIDKCSFEWTKIEEGISVVLSPGAYNPAHPEIAALARRSGLPLVKMRDLYIDDTGFVRLVVSVGDHPIVSGIYNRKEESFLIYSEKFKIPLRSPFTAHNKELARKYNTELKEGILYSYTYDDDFKINGVDIDSKTGQAKYQTLFEKISPAPSANHSGDIIEAVWNKKLFISNLGGRVFDDKRAFRIISDFLLRANEHSAHPPKSVSTFELSNQFENTVIKAPDLSGGLGVLIGAQANSKEKNEILDLVSKRPEYYELQELTKLAVINTISVKDKSTEYEIRPLPVDWRLIIFSTPNEEPKMSTHSCLVRTAPYGSIKTNTSSGGGYALGLIYNETVQAQLQQENTPIKFIPKSRQEDLRNFKNSIDLLIETKDRTNLESLIYQLRDLMDLIGLEHITWINSLRGLQLEFISFDEFTISYENFLATSEILTHLT